MSNQQLLKQVSEQVGAGIWCALAEEYGRGFSGYKDEKRFSNQISIPGTIAQTITWGGLVERPAHHPTKLQSEGVNEVLALEYITRNTYQPVTRSRPSSAFWGIAGKLGAAEDYVTQKKAGERPVAHQELVRDGTEEQACLLQYGAFDAKGEGFYIFEGRAGQILWVDMVLPRSTGEKVFTAVEREPSFAREVVEAVILQNVGIAKEYWQKGYVNYRDMQGSPLRPPYEHWAKAGGGVTKFALQNPNAAFGDGGRELWREHSIVDMR